VKETEEGERLLEKSGNKQENYVPWNISRLEAPALKERLHLNLCPIIHSCMKLWLMFYILVIAIFIKHY